MILSIGKSVIEVKDNDETTKLNWVDACALATEEGYRLPTRKELKAIHKALHEKSLGGFNNEPYWTADKNGKENAWYISFINGNDNWSKITDYHNVRMIKTLG